MPIVNKDELIATLAELGGSQFQESQITQHGTQLIIPEQMTVQRAIDTLQSFQKSQGTETEFVRTFKYRPLDGAVATVRALKKLTGAPGIAKATESFFGSIPPRMIDVATGVNDSIQVPWGEIYVELWEGPLVMGSARDDGGYVFEMSIYAARAYAPVIEGFFKLIEAELKAESIYRGKALYGDLTFYDAWSVNPAEVHYSADTQWEIDTHLWSPIRNTEAVRSVGLPIKRTVLLEGEYGTGKTLCGALTAQIAVEHDWTFIYSRPDDELEEVLSTARLYAPAVVFCEDVDRLASPENTDDDASAMLDLFDGLGAKGRDVMLILTSNHPERLHKGIVRPGRLDAIIEFGALDAPALEELASQIIGDVALDGLDYHVIEQAFADYSPAYVRESLDRAKRYSIARTGELDSITTQDIVGAAKGLRSQLELMQDAPEFSEADELNQAMENLVTRSVESVLDKR